MMTIERCHVCCPLDSSIALHVFLSCFYFCSNALCLVHVLFRLWHPLPRPWILIQYSTRHRCGGVGIGGASTSDTRRDTGRGRADTHRQTRAPEILFHRRGGDETEWRGTNNDIENTHTHLQDSEISITPIRQVSHRSIVCPPVCIDSIASFTSCF